MQLPEAFLIRMQRELGEEFSAFLASYDTPAERGIRVNTLKLTADAFRRIAPFALAPVPWEENGFYVAEEKVGAHPYHFAGLYYAQEPSAMSAVPLLEVVPGDRVLDLCSAPGGKGTQIASALQGEGLLVLNEKVPDRAKILSQNVERMGIRNAVVLNESPDAIAPHFSGYFNKILVDAPCSGEGMFQKEAAALSEWSEQNVAMCARRQAAILRSAAEMLAGGGTLVYSTCTFAPAEDELQVEAFLAAHPEFSCVLQKKYYPHRERGEGHFVAKLVKENGERGELRLQKAVCGKREEALYRTFEASFSRRREENLHLAGDSLYALPEGCFSLKGLRVLRAGVKLGILKKDRFEPDHALVLAMRREELRPVVDTDCTGILPYLRGEPIVADGAKNGWCAVCVDGFPVGLGKITDGTVKNHYPKGLRLRAKGE